jgi:hypothetical protein
MRKKILVLLFALVLSANLRAQVTIGGLNAPKAGALLDLNSGAKGGLILSNVALDNIGEIPAGFPGMTPENTDAAKAQLKGAMIYNTNPNTCVGVHAWDGNHWSRVISPQKSTGSPLSITSSTVNAIGGDSIEFTLNTEAKTYTWYINKNGAGYEYLDVTTEPKLLAAIPAGTIKVKAITDNCHMLEESNEVTLQPESLSPNFGSVAGGNTIYIYGDFPYASTGEYVQSGLVAHFDGINNTGEGDKSHSNSAVEWPNIKDMSFFLSKVGTGGYWTQTGFKFNNNVYFQKGTLNDLDNLPAYIPNGNNPHTVEAIFTNPASSEEKNCGRWNDFVSYGGNLPLESTYIQQHYNNADPCIIDVSLGVAHYDYDNKLFFDNLPPLNIPNTLHSVQAAYDGPAIKNTRVYIDGSQETPSRISGGDNTLSLTREVMSFGGWVDSSPIFSTTNFNLHSVRIYDRALEDYEIAKNAALDQIRYLDPPKVKIDGVPCTEVVVLSPHFLMCKVPASTSGVGHKDVEITSSIDTLTLDDAYEYVDAATAFYISSISRIIGSAGNTLTLTGNKFEDIVEVKVGNVTCPTSIDTTGADGTDTCTFTLPNLNLLGEVDITITTNSRTYRFAKVFEYK